MKIILAGVLAVFVSYGALADVERKTVPDALSARDNLVDQLLTVSGMKKSLQRLPEQTIQSFAQSVAKSQNSDEARKAMVTIYVDSFPKDAFVNHVSEALKKNYDERRYAHLLKTLSTPLAEKMANLEAVEPQSADIRNFLSQVASHPLPPERIRLIKKMDSATQDSALMSKMMIASIEASALVAADDCNNISGQISKLIEKNKPNIEKANRSTAQAMLAFTYREVSDADLKEYLDLYQDKDNKWVLNIVQSAMVEQFKSSVTKSAQGIGAYVRAQQPKKTMFAPKCTEKKTGKS